MRFCRYCGHSFRDVRFEDPTIRNIIEVLGEISGALNKAESAGYRLQNYYQDLYEKYYPESKNFKNGSININNTLRAKIKEAVRSLEAVDRAFDYDKKFCK